MQKARRILALALTLALVLTFASISTITATANVPLDNLGVVFPYLFSGFDWRSGFNQHSGPGTFAEFDARNPGYYTFEMEWTRADTRWRSDGGMIVLLRPTGGGNQTNIEIASIFVNDERVFGDMGFSGGGSFWNHHTTLVSTSANPFNNGLMLPVGNATDTGVTVESSALPNHNINVLSIDHAMPAVEAGDVISVTVRVGDRPSVNLGSTTGAGTPTAQDITNLRRAVASRDRDAFFAANQNFRPQNFDVNGDGFINSTDVTLLRRYVANDRGARLGPDFFISFTYDDGPNEMTMTVAPAPVITSFPPPTQSILDGLQILNSREHTVCTRWRFQPGSGTNWGSFTQSSTGLACLGDACGVVCGRNGIHACRPGVGCGRVCGSQSRAKLTFYPMGIDGFTLGGTPAVSPGLIQRMLREGHSVDNHTENHNISPSTGINRSGPLGLDNHGPQFSSRNYIQNQILMLDQRIRQHSGGVTDFYGNTYGSGNPHTTFSFRPNQFTMPIGGIGVDRDPADGGFSPNPGGQPWVFGRIDPWDWTGHRFQFMRDFILYGALDWCGGSGGGDQHDCWGSGREGFRDTRPPNVDPNQWCAIRNSTYSGAADGGADGSVVLLHDGGRGWDRRPTIEVTMATIPILQEMGYHIVTVEQLFYYKNAEPEWIPDWSPGNNPPNTTAIPGGMWPLWDGARQFANGWAYSSANFWNGANAPMRFDDRVGPAEGQGSQFGTNGSVRRNQGDRAGWMARTGYTPTRILRNAGNAGGI